MKLTDLGAALQELESQQLLRRPDDQLVRCRLAEQWGEDFLDASSNDYLGLRCAGSAHVSRETAAIGAGASRLVFGTDPAHRAVERTVAEWLNYPQALLFSSGYAANVGTLSCLLSPGDAVFSDRLNHASLIDGIRLSRARPQIFAHNDLDDLQQRLEASRQAPARWVVVESYYSMDGDSPDFTRLAELCRAFDAALYVDEAHGLGVFGAEGRGVAAVCSVRPDVLVAAFGKAVGAQGACVLGSTELRQWLWNRARSFVFSTAPSPLLSEALAVQIARARAADSARLHLTQLGDHLRAQLHAAGIPLGADNHGPIVSLVAGEAQRAMTIAERLRARGILCQAIRPPTVPRGTSRLRSTINANWTFQQADRLCSLLAELWH